jgi:Spy/CpxP family protein refolding chaperone
MREHLDLTEEQESKITEMKIQLKKDIIPMRDQIKQLQTEIKLQMTSEKFDEARVEKMLQEIGKIQQKMKLMKLKNQRAVRDLLSADQQKKFDMHILSEKGPARHHRMEKGRMRGPGQNPQMRMKRNQHQ